jgi:BirA family transcriptional regulator, biotin operon repressor / biotin---[acetyl-CoA-carboxylase] ligase
VAEDSPRFWSGVAGALAEGLEEVLPGRWAAVEVLQSVDSTNGHVLRRADLVSDRYHVCIAREQTAGRGRRGRAWVGCAGHALTFSVGRALGPGEASSPALTLAAGVGLARGLSVCGFGGFGLKWPNDLITENGAKLAGILVEARGEGGGRMPGALVVGVGLNRSGASELRLDRPVADLGDLSGPRSVPLPELLRAVLTQLVLAWEGFTVSGLGAFVDEFAGLDRLRGRTIEVLDTGERGVALGIDPMDGALLVARRGETVRLYSGDVSVRAAEHV